MRHLRVATLNIWGRQGPWPERQRVIRQLLDELAPDVMGLQEVIHLDLDRAPPGTQPNEPLDQALALVEGTQMHTAYGGALDLGFGYSFGNAIVSRFPLRSVEIVALPGEVGVEPRVAISALVETPFGPVPFFSTHLAWRFDQGALRLRQVMALAAAVERRQVRGGYPAIVVGDFNAQPDSDEIRFLRGLHVAGGSSTYFIDAFGEAGEGEGATYARRNPFAEPLGEPDRRIDFVFVRGRDARGWGRPLSARLAFDEARPPSAGAAPIFGSDHFGVVADLLIPPMKSEGIA